MADLVPQDAVQQPIEADPGVRSNALAFALANSP